MIFRPSSSSRYKRRGEWGRLELVERVPSAAASGLMFAAAIRLCPPPDRATTLMKRKTRAQSSIIWRAPKRAGGEADRVARMKSYELAAKMQLAAPAVADLSRESAKVKSSYGLDDPVTADAGRRCLLARRLLERGVRFVQVYSGGPMRGTRTSRAHENAGENHGAEAARIDRPVTAPSDEQRALDDTLVIFDRVRSNHSRSRRRMLLARSRSQQVRLSCWLAGAGLKPGTAFGETGRSAEGCREPGSG